MGMSVLCKAIEFLGRTIFSNQILFSSGSGAKDKKGWNSRKFNGWSSGSGSVTDSWWLFYWSHWKSLCSLIIQEPLTQMFTGSLCYSLGLIMIPNTWIKKAGILPSQKCTTVRESFLHVLAFPPAVDRCFLLLDMGIVVETGWNFLNCSCPTLILGEPCAPLLCICGVLGFNRLLLKSKPNWVSCFSQQTKVLDQIASQVNFTKYSKKK